MSRLSAGERLARRLAQRAVSAAVNRGELVRPAVCSRCGRKTGYTVAHHHLGYAPEHQLEVVWVCFDCHPREHDRMAAMHSAPLALVLALLLGGCGTTGERLNTDGPAISYFHDDAHLVSCWLYGDASNTGKAISCLPDSQVQR